MLRGKGRGERNRIHLIHSNLHAIKIMMNIEQRWKEKNNNCGID
jgi:hypothetical protein